MRKIKIIATVGPACEKDKVLQALTHAGVDLFRINASHVTKEQIVSWCERIRRNHSGMKHKPQIMLDLQGPRIRTGKVAGGVAISIESSQNIKLLPGTQLSTKKEIFTPYVQLFKSLKPNHRVFIDNGLIKLVVNKAFKNGALCRVVRGGKLGANKGINLPDTKIQLETLTEKDMGDLQVGIDMKVDWMAMSFVQHAKDVQLLKSILKKRGSKIPVIAKIEKPQAVTDIRYILNHADAVMVARGDLGIETAVEKVPVIQKKIIHMCNEKKVPVITATEMLESMITKPRPTRAEASDVANAVLDGTDMVMLSGETAAGWNPVAVVQTMQSIIDAAQLYQKTL